MEFFEMIGKRHSVRRFAEKSVPEEVIAGIIKAAMSAPSSKNSRSSSFMVIDKPELIERIARMRDYGSAFIANAPLVVLVMGDPALSDIWLVNASISATYLQLAVEASGLGSCWAHVDGRTIQTADPASQTSEDYLRTFLPIHIGRRILCAIAIGYPAR